MIPPTRRELLVLFLLASAVVAEVLSILADLATLVPGFARLIQQVPGLLVATQVSLLVPLILALVAGLAIVLIVRGRSAAREKEKPSPPKPSVSSDLLGMLSRKQAEREKPGAKRRRAEIGRRAVRRPADPPRLERQDFDG